jgi:hypothetical protein
VSKISFEELDALAGEMLPERAVLSTVVPFHGGGNDGAIANNVCVSQSTPGNPGGLLNLGIGGHPATSSVTCSHGSTVAF